MNNSKQNKKDKQVKEKEYSLVLILQESNLQEAKLKAKHKKEEMAAQKNAEEKENGHDTTNPATAFPKWNRMGMG